MIDILHPYHRQPLDNLANGQKRAKNAETKANKNKNVPSMPQRFPYGMPSVPSMRKLYYPYGTATVKIRETLIQSHLLPRLAGPRIKSQFGV